MPAEILGGGQTNSKIEWPDGVLSVMAIYRQPGAHLRLSLTDAQDRKLYYSVSCNLP